MHILAISTSLRPNSRSKTALEQLKKTMKGPHQWTDYKLIDEDGPLFCEGCLACHTGGKCYKKSHQKIGDYFQAADVIVLAMPIFYGALSSASKGLLECIYPLRQKQVAGKKLVLILAASKEGQEGLAIMEVLPWCYSHGLVLCHVETVTETSQGHDMKNIEAVIKGDTPLTSLEFDDFSYMNKTATVPKRYGLQGGDSSWKP